MEHRTLRGRLDYITDDVGITGREWFTLTTHTDGRRTMRALTAMDDDKVMRDVTFSVDKDWHALDCFIRLTVNDRFQGTGWFRFSDSVVECESYTRDGGRISQRWPVDGHVPMFVNHSVMCDAWGATAFDMRRKDEIQSFYPRLTSSPLANGGSGPMIGNTTTMTPESGKMDVQYLGDEEITVAAGTFKCSRYMLNPGKIPRFEMWVHGPDFLMVQLRWDRRKKWYRLAELETLES
jgi:hypothetical protein